MNIDDLTLGQAKELTKFIGQNSDGGLCDQIGEKVIIRTYAAGVFFGTLFKKHKNEVILVKARRMWRWHSEESISLSGVAKAGIDQSKSRIAPLIDKIWLQPIEIISLSERAIKSIETAIDTEKS